MLQGWTRILLPELQSVGLTVHDCILSEAWGRTSNKASSHHIFPRMRQLGLPVTNLSISQLQKRGIREHRDQVVSQTWNFRF